MATFFTSSLVSGEKISAFVPVREFKEGSFLVMATKNGLIKKTAIILRCVLLISMALT